MQVIIGPGDLVDMRQPRRECLDAIHRAKREFGDTDIYNIYEDVCRYDSGCGDSAARNWGAHSACVSVRTCAAGPLVL